MTRITVAAASVVSALVFAATAQASPENPYADDWVALAYSPSTNQGGWGTSGTDLGANSIALAQCGQNSGNAIDCVLTATTHVGCVAYAAGPAGAWVGGQGPDEGGAIQDAANQALARPDASAYNLGGVHCSKPQA